MKFIILMVYLPLLVIIFSSSSVYLFLDYKRKIKQNKVFNCSIWACKYMQSLTLELRCVQSYLHGRQSFFSIRLGCRCFFIHFTLHHGTSYKLRKTNQLCQIYMYKGFRNCANMQKDMQSNWNQIFDSLLKDRYTKVQQSIRSKSKV